MEERMRFIVRLLEGEEMNYLCQEFGLEEDRLQDLQSLQGMWIRGAEGQVQASVSLWKPVTDPD